MQTGKELDPNNSYYVLSYWEYSRIAVLFGLKFSLFLTKYLQKYRGNDLLFIICDSIKTEAVIGHWGRCLCLFHF